MNVIQHIGLDVHNDSIAVSIAPGDSAEVRRWGILGGTHDHVQRFVQQLQRARRARAGADRLRSPGRAGRPLPPRPRRTGLARCGTAEALPDRGAPVQGQKQFTRKPPRKRKRPVTPPGSFNQS